MAKFNYKKKEELEKLAQSHPLAGTDKDQAKFESVLNVDPRLGELYRDTYDKLRMDKEADELIAEELHEKYDYLYDKSYQKFVEVDDMFDPTQHDKELEDELFTTDLSDMESQHIYKRYKLMFQRNRKSIEDVREQIKTLTMEMTQRRAMHPFKKGNVPLRQVEEYQNVVSKLLRQKEEKQKLNALMEDFMSSLRFAHEMRKL